MIALTKTGHQPSTNLSFVCVLAPHPQAQNFDGDSGSARVNVQMCVSDHVVFPCMSSQSCVQVKAHA
jgi:DNA-binding MurR/RpiR family transcriptional regulator